MVHLLGSNSPSHRFDRWERREFARIRCDPAHSRLNELHDRTGYGLHQSLRMRRACRIGTKRLCSGVRAGLLPQRVRAAGHAVGEGVHQRHRQWRLPNAMAGPSGDYGTV